MEELDFIPKIPRIELDKSDALDRLDKIYNSIKESINRGDIIMIGSQDHEDFVKHYFYTEKSEQGNR